MANTYTWSVVATDTRVVNNVPITAGSGTLQSVTVINSVTMKCVSSGGGSGGFTDRIILADPLTVDTAITQSSSNSAILAAGQVAIGQGGNERYQTLADAAK